VRRACVVLVLVSACATTAVASGDPLRDRQWGLDAVATVDRPGDGVTVAVIDSGVDADQPDLAGRVEPGIDLVDGDDVADDGYGHGTHVAGIIAAESDNGIGMAGIAPGARILPVRVLDDEGNGDYRRTAEGIRWAVDHGAQVLNLSVTLAHDDERVREAVAYAREHNVVMVAAAGNRRCPEHGTNDTVYPAAYPGVLGVGAAGESGQVAGFSSCGPWVDLVAPGVGIISITSAQARADECRGNDGWCLLTGTSEAVPFVAAAAALRISQLDVYDAQSVMDDIVASATDIAPAGRDDRTGAGRLDIAALLTR